MPLYEYQCSACGYQDTLLEKMQENSVKECKKCHQPSFKRQISAPNFLLKGGGWFKDNYGSSKKASDQSKSSE